MMYLEALRVLKDTNPVIRRVTDFTGRVLSRPVSRVLMFVLFIAVAILTAHGIALAQSDPTNDFFTKISTLLTGGFGKGVALIGLLLGAILIFLNQIGVGIMVILGALLIALAPTIISFIFS